MPRNIALEPAVVRASVAAYEEVLRTLIGPTANRHALPDNVRSEISSAIVDLAAAGVRDPEALTEGALARLRLTSLTSSWPAESRESTAAPQP